MNPFNEIIYNENVKRQVFLKRHRNGLRARLEEALREHDLDYSERFSSSFLRLSNRDFRSLAQATDFNTDRLKDFRSAVRSLAKSSYDVANDLINKELDELVYDEYKFQESLVRRARRETDEFIPVIKSTTRTKLKKYRSLEPLVNTTQEDYLTNWSQNRSRKLLEEVRKQIKRGLDPKDIIKKVRGTEKRFSGILKDTHFGASLGSNTLHVSATSAANFAFVDLNTSFDLLVSAVLDSGSAKVCVLNHNRLIQQDNIAGRSPYHLNCNTRVFPYLKGDTVPERESFASWWRRQNDDVRLQFLGRKRFEMAQNDPSIFNSAESFISEETGRFITLNELRDSSLN